MSDREPSPKSEREARLAEALRKNLRRRKAPAPPPPVKPAQEES